MNEQAFRAAYESGEAAYVSGDPIGVCPNHKSEEYAEAWASGWLQKEEQVARDSGLL